MNKELIDHVWKHCLPKEFKEEVKRLWSVEVDCATKYHSELHKHRTGLLYELFGDNLHWQNNLTSDAEGEEMLMVPRKKVQEKWQRAYEQEAKYSKAEQNPTTREELYYNRGIMSVIDTLFGSKCLPDEKDDCKKFTKKLDDTLEGEIKEPFKEWYDKNYSNLEKLEKNGEVEPKPAEPKFAKGDMIHCKFFGYEGDYRVIGYTDGSPKYYACIDKDGFNYRFPESYLEPYTEPKEEASKMKPIESKMSVYLATKEEDEEFRLLLHKNGFKWHTNTPLINLTCWSSVFKDSHIHCVHPDKTVTYCGEKTSDTLTFSEFKKRYFEENVNLSQNTANCDKQFNNILKDSFSKERRLNIAAMITQGIMANPNPQMVEMDMHRVAGLAILMADTLIAECEKGGSHGED